MLTVFTFGDSILDCSHYNAHQVDPGRLLVANDDHLFPVFRGRDLSSRGPARLEPRAIDGTIRDDPVLIGSVYDPTFGNDELNVFGVDSALGRENHRRVNAVLANLGAAHGAFVDLHAHFLKGDPTWFSNTIEPSLFGASEVRRCFMEAIEANRLPGI